MRLCQRLSFQVGIPADLTMCVLFFPWRSVFNMNAPPLRPALGPPPSFGSWTCPRATFVLRSSFFTCRSGGVACPLFPRYYPTPPVTPTPDYKWAFIVFVVYTIALMGWYATFFVFKDGPLSSLSVLRSSGGHEFLDDAA